MKKLILILLSLFAFACNKKNDVIQSQETEKNEVLQEQNITQDKDIEQLKFFAENDMKTVTDENGISYRLELDIKEISRSEKFKSEKIPDSDGDIIVVSSYEVKYQFDLISNGEIKNSLQYDGYLLECMEFNKFHNFKPAPDGFCSHVMAYFPKLDGIDIVGGTGNPLIYENRKKVVSEFTNINCGRGEPINSQIIRLSIEAVNKSGILDL